MVTDNSIIALEERRTQLDYNICKDFSKGELTTIQPDMKTPPAIYTMVSESCTKGLNNLDEHIISGLLPLFQDSR